MSTHLGPRHLLTGSRVAAAACIAAVALLQLVACDDSKAEPDGSQAATALDSGVMPNDSTAKTTPDSGATTNDSPEKTTPVPASDVIYRSAFYALAVEADEDAGVDDELPDGVRACDSAADCPPDDGVFCNGTIACEPYRSLNGRVDTGNRRVCIQVLPCPMRLLDDKGNLKKQLCDESNHACDCNPLNLEGQVAWYCNPGKDLPPGMRRTNDIDGDNVDHDSDCDDGDPRRNPTTPEICDENGLDEDCDIDSVVKRDRDGDDHYDEVCLNVDPITGLRHPVPGVDDCEDRINAINPEARESCDYQDNDCDHKIDEDSGGRELGLHRDLCIDNDGDGYVLESTEHRRMCLDEAPIRWIACPPPEGPFDCDDDPARCGTKCQPGLPESCDGYDNDCNTLVDDDDDTKEGGIQARPSFSDGTRVECRYIESIGRTSWAVLPETCPLGTQWCDETTAYNGCETDITTRYRCGGCEADIQCNFACDWKGPNPGCDELAQFNVGRESVCAVTKRGRLACWGRGAEGQLGNGMRAGSARPVEASIEQVHSVSVGLRHVCAIAGANRTVYCWGSDARNGSTTDDGQPVYGLLGSVEAYEQGSDTPVEVNAASARPRLSSIEHLSLGYYHACAVTSDSQVMCWGDFHEGRLGHGPWEYPDPDFVVDQAGIPVQATEVSLGIDHSCAISVDQKVLCWGSNSVGQLGYAIDHDFAETPDTSETGSIQTFRTYATEVPGLSNITHVAAGGFHTCAIDRDKRLWCWGNNQLGTLGRADSELNYIPGVVAGLPPVRAIAAGTQNTCIVAEETEEGSVMCWGSRSSGFMGMPLEGIEVSPKLLNLPRAKAISGWETLCIVPEVGTARCLGVNDHGQVGSGKPPSQDSVIVPEQLVPLTE